MSRLWLMWIAVSLSLAACGASSPQVAQPNTSPSRTTVTVTTNEPSASATATAEQSSAAPTTRTATAEQSSTALTEATSTTEHSTTNDPVSKAKNELLSLLNERRVENNCPELVLDERLQAAAQGHAQDIARRRRIDQRGSDGTTLEQRLERSGYPFQRQTEILAIGLGFAPRTVAGQWLSEPEGGEHRSAILDCEYRDVGIGIGQTQPNVSFWVVNFGQQKP